MESQPTPFLAPALGGAHAPGPGDAPELGGANRTRACRVCRRPLTDPESVMSGVGPVCARVAGYNRFDPARIPTYKVKGERGITEPGVQAVKKAVGKGKVKRIVVVSYLPDPSPQFAHLWHHGALLELTNGSLELVADGFCSGYRGEGPRGLASVAAEALKLQASPLSIILDTEHANALFDGELDPLQIVHLARPLVITEVPDTHQSWSSSFRIDPEVGDHLQFLSFPVMRRLPLQSPQETP